MPALRIQHTYFEKIDTMTDKLTTASVLAFERKLTHLTPSSTQAAGTTAHSRTPGSRHRPRKVCARHHQQPPKTKDQDPAKLDAAI